MNLEPIIVDHTPQCRSARTHYCNDDVLALLECRIYHQTINMHDKKQTSSLASLEAM